MDETKLEKLKRLFDMDEWEARWKRQYCMIGGTPCKKYLGIYEPQKNLLYVHCANHGPVSFIQPNGSEIKSEKLDVMLYLNTTPEGEYDHKGIAEWKKSCVIELIDKPKRKSEIIESLKTETKTYRLTRPLSEIEAEFNEMDYRRGYCDGWILAIQQMFQTTRQRELVKFWENELMEWKNREPKNKIIEAPLPRHWRERGLK